MRKRIIQTIGLAFMAGALFLLGVLLVGIRNSKMVFGVRNILTILILMACALMIGARIFVSTLKNVSQRYVFMKVGISILFLGYVLALVITMILDTSMLRNDTFGGMKDNQSANFIPGATIYNFFRLYSENMMNFSTVVENLFGNIIMFVPFGFFGPILIHKLKRFRNYILTIFIIVISLELIQYILNAGAFDVDDIILNVGGSCLAYVMYRLSFVQWILKKLYIEGEKYDTVS